MAAPPSVDFEPGSPCCIGGRRTPVTILSPMRNARSSGLRRMSLSPGSEEEDESLTPCSFSRGRRCSASSRSPSLCDSGCEESPSSVEGSAGGGSRCHRRRPSISELSDTARMTPEAQAMSGAGFPWLREPGLCKIDLGCSNDGAVGHSEREHALTFCLLATPELRGDASPLQGGCSEASNYEEVPPRALQQSFEDQDQRQSPDGLSSLPPHRLVQLRCPASLRGATGHDAMPQVPASSPPLRPPPQKRLRPAKVVLAGGGA